VLVNADPPATINAYFDPANNKGITKQTAGLVYNLNIAAADIQNAGGPNASSVQYDFNDDGTAAGAARWFNLTLTGA
jgi:hypothetical protein